MTYLCQMATTRKVVSERAVNDSRQHVFSYDDNELLMKNISEISMKNMMKPDRHSL